MIHLGRVAFNLVIAFAMFSCQAENVSVVSPPYRPAPQQAVRFTVTSQGVAVNDASVEVARANALEGGELDRLAHTGPTGTAEFPLVAGAAYVAMVRSVDNTVMARIEFSLPTLQHDVTTPIGIPAALLPAGTLRGRILVPGETQHDHTQVGVNLFAYRLGAITAMDGSYELPLPPGRWFLKLARNGYPLTTVPIDGPPSGGEVVVPDMTLGAGTP